MSNPRILIIGGGILQSFLVEECRKKNYFSIVIDENPNCYCKSLCDSFFQCSTKDHQGALRIGRLNQINAVITAGTDVGYTVSYVAFHLHLHACHPSASYSAQNKIRMRDLLNLHHPVFLPQPQSYFEWESLCEAQGISPYPCVLKPADMSASRGIRFPKSREEFYLQYWETLAESPSKQILVEEKIGSHSNEEVAVDCAIFGTKIYVVNSARRVFSDSIPGLEVGYINPAFDKVPNEIKSLAHYAAKYLDVKEGPFKMDLKHDAQYGWCLLECATRWSGAFDHNFAAQQARNFNYTSELLDYALTGFFGMDLAETHMKPPLKYVACVTPQFPVGQLMTQDLLHEFSSSSGVIKVFQVHSMQLPHDSCASRPLFVFASGDTANQALHNAQASSDKWNSLEASRNAVPIQGLSDAQ